MLFLLILLAVLKLSSFALVRPIVDIVAIFRRSTPASQTLAYRHVIDYMSEVASNDV